MKQYKTAKEILDDCLPNDFLIACVYVDEEEEEE